MSFEKHPDKITYIDLKTVLQGFIAYYQDTYRYGSLGLDTKYAKEVGTHAILYRKPRFWFSKKLRYVSIYIETNAADKEVLLVMAYQNYELGKEVANFLSSYFKEYEVKYSYCGDGPYTY